MSDGEQPIFRLNPKIERTLRRNRRERHWLNKAKNMENKNNQNNLANQNDQGQNLAYLAHDLDQPIRSYASPNLYDFNPRITYLTFLMRMQGLRLTCHAPNVTERWTIWRTHTRGSSR